MAILSNNVNKESFMNNQPLIYFLNQFYFIFFMEQILKKKMFLVRTTGGALVVYNWSNAVVVVSFVYSFTSSAFFGLHFQYTKHRKE